MNKPTQAPNPHMGQVIPLRRAATTAEAPAAFPGFTWEELEQQLLDLAARPSQQAMVSSLVSATRKQSTFKPPQQVLREMLCIASVLMDETFHAEPGEGEMS